MSRSTLKIFRLRRALMRALFTEIHNRFLHLMGAGPTRAAGLAWATALEMVCQPSDLASPRDDAKTAALKAALRRDKQAGGERRAAGG